MVTISVSNEVLDALVVILWVIAVLWAINNLLDAILFVQKRKVLKLDKKKLQAFNERVELTDDGVRIKGIIYAWDFWLSVSPDQLNAKVHTETFTPDPKDEALARNMHVVAPEEVKPPKK